MTSRAESHALTRAALLREARRLFSTDGYAAVGLAQVVAAAGVTKGALYHHFESKSDLFAAVLEEVATEVAAKVADSAREHDDPWDQLLTGCRAFLTASTATGVAQIMLLDGPAVLGWQRWRAIDDRTSGHDLIEGIEALYLQPVEPIARLLSGAMNEAALWLAGQASPDAIEEVWAALEPMVESLRD